jgi:hypothetical protein
MGVYPGRLRRVPLVRGGAVQPSLCARAAASTRAAEGTPGKDKPLMSTWTTWDEIPAEIRGGMQWNCRFVEPGGVIKTFQCIEVEPLPGGAVRFSDILIDTSEYATSELSGAPQLTLIRSQFSHVDQMIVGNHGWLARKIRLEER